MEGFRQALIDLTEPNESGAPTRKLVVVIDELDRCRPDYSLFLLEVVKHFFDTHGVHFVLGTNAKELQNSVRARYGSLVDAQTYLQKFVNLTFGLPAASNPSRPISIWVNHFRQCSVEMRFPEQANPLLDMVETVLGSLKIGRQVSLRDAERVLTTLATLPDLNIGLRSTYRVGVATMVVLKTFFPDEYQIIRSRTATPFRYTKFFDKNAIMDTQLGGRIELFWRAIEDYSSLEQQELSVIGQMDFLTDEHDFAGLLTEVSNNFLETFQFYES